MSRLRIAPIVEGHGEVGAVPILLRRIWTELLGGEYADVLHPVRVPRTKLIRPSGDKENSPQIDSVEVRRAVELAIRKIAVRSDPSMASLVLLLLDADADCPADLGPRIDALIRDCNGVCVLAKVEYETWFVAAAQSLSEFIGEVPDVPDDPETHRAGKGWIANRFRGGKYSEIVDQPRMTARMDLAACRMRAPSFDKLCRELLSRRSTAS